MDMERKPSATPLLRNASTSSETSCNSQSQDVFRPQNETIEEVDDHHQGPYHQVPESILVTNPGRVSACNSVRGDGVKAKNKPPRNSRSCACLAGALTLGLMSLGGVFFLVYFVIKFQNELVELKGRIHTMQIQQPDIVTRGLCLPCSLLRLGSPEEQAAVEGLQRYPADEPSWDGDEDCCARDRNQFRILFHSYVESRTREEKATEGHLLAQTQHSKGTDPVPCMPRAPNNLSVVAHLPAMPPPPGEQPQATASNSAGKFYNKGQVPIRFWKTNHTFSVFSDNLHYRFGRLIIREPGVYFVYSQVYFVEYFSNQSEGQVTSSYSHYIYKYNPILPNGGNERLLHHSQTPCWSRNKDHHEYTSYVAGVFRLLPEDEIFIRVNNLSVVNWDPKSTYFGLYLIGPP